MANKAKNAKTGKKENEFESNVGEILSRSEQFIENNKKNIIIGISAVVLIVVAIVGIRYGYLIPREKEAQEAIFRGEFYFQNGEWDKALYGDSAQFIGFESIISKYRFTRTASLAGTYSGICYFHKGDFEKAIGFLKSSGANDRMVSPAVTGLVGDCYVEMDKTKEGIKFFLKAADKANDNLVSPIYLKKAGRAYESLNEFKKALEVYTTIKEKYPTSREAQDIDRFIIRANLKL